MKMTFALALLGAPLLLGGCLFKKGADPCDDYCAFMELNCQETFEDVDDDGFDSDACYRACENFESRPFTTPTPPSEDSLECRVYHAELAAGEALANNAHCGHASPEGANTCSDFRSDTCRELCEGDGEAFGGISDSCVTELPPLDDETGIPPTTLGSRRCAKLCIDLSEDSRNCRLDSARQVVESGDLGNLCDQARTESPTCN